MFNVRSDPARNRLYITLAGHLDASERKAVMKAMLTEAGKLTPGFDVVSDITELHPSDEEGFKDFLRAKSGLKLKGAGNLVRVVKLPISRIQVERISTEAGFPSDHVDSLEAADRRLDELRAKSKHGA